MPFVTKDLSKAIMKRSKLRNNYLENKNDASRMLYKKQRNSCVLLLRKSNTNYYETRKKCPIISFFGM